MQAIAVNKGYCCFGNNNLILSLNINLQLMKWEAKAIVHKKEKRIAVWFPKEALAIERIKQLADAKWSATLNAWHLPDNNVNRDRFKLEPIVVKPHIAFDKTEEIEAY
jgi:integrase/recombinase XerD